MLGLVTAILIAAAPVSAQQMGEAGQMPAAMPDAQAAPVEAAPYDGRPYCRPGEQEGACQTSPEPASVHFTWGFDLLWGIADSEMPLHPVAFAIAMPFEFGLTRALGIGLRYTYLVSGDRGVDDQMTPEYVDAADTTNLNAHLISAGLRLHLWTDEVDRQGWFAELDGGWLARHDGLGDGPALRVTLGRQAGWSSLGGWGGSFGLGLTYLHGLAAAEDFRALLLELHLLRVEAGIPLPQNADEPEQSAFAYVFGGELTAVGGNVGSDYQSFAMLGGGGFWFGVPIVPALAPLLRADILYTGGEKDRDGVTMFAGLGGLRVRWNGVLPIYTEVLGGYERAYGTQPAPIGHGPILDVAVALHHPIATAGCGAFGLGVRTRWGLGDDNEQLRAIFFTLHLEYGSRQGAIGGGYGSVWRAECDAGRGDFYAPPPAPPTVSVGADVSAGGSVDLSVPDVQIPNVGVNVEVDVEPVVVEVVLGYALFGGAVRFEIRAETLPLSQLQNAGFVEVRIEGPRGALAQAEANLRATLGRSGARLDGLATADTGGTEVRAIFTIWPPGSRPPGR